MKKSILIIISVFLTISLFAQSFSRRELSINKSKRNFKFNTVDYIIGDLGRKSIVTSKGDTIINTRWSTNNFGKEIMKSFMLKNSKCSPYVSDKYENKECYHEAISNNQLIQYFIEFLPNKAVIKCEVRSLKDMHLIKSTILKELDHSNLKLNATTGYKYNIHAASSKNGKYVVFVIDLIKRIDEPNLRNYYNSFKTKVLRADIDEDKIEEFNYPLNESQLIYAFNNRKVAVSNQGALFVTNNILAISNSNISKLKKLRKLKRKAHLKKNEQLQEIIHSSSYINLVYFNKEGLASRHKLVFEKYFHNDYDILVTKDERLMLYGYAGPSYSNFSNTIFSTFFDSEVELFSKMKFTHFSEETNFEYTLKGLDDVESSQMPIVPFGIVELDNGKFISIASWRTKVVTRSRVSAGGNQNMSFSMVDDVSFLYFNQHYIVFNSEGSVVKQKVEKNIYGKSIYGNDNSLAETYIVAHGNKAFVTSSQSQKFEKKMKRKKKSCAIFSNVMLCDVDEELNMEKHLVKRKKGAFSLYVYVYGTPYYDDLSDSWLVNLVNRNEVTLERWKF